MTWPAKILGRSPQIRAAFLSTNAHTGALALADVWKRMYSENSLTAPHLKKRLCNSYSSQKLKWYFQVKYTFIEASVWTEKFNRRVCYLAQNQEEPEWMWHRFSGGLPCSTPRLPILSEMLGIFPCSCNNFPLQIHHWKRHALDFWLWLKRGHVEHCQ